MVYSACCDIFVQKSPATTIEILAQAIKEIYNANIDPSCSHINIGTGKDCSILELSELISDVIDFKGDIITDTSKPDGMPKKLLDVSLLAKLGWEYKTNIREGLEKTYEWFLENQDSLRSKENFSSSKIT